MPEETPKPIPNKSPAKVDVGTSLALLRTYLASERTMMAWIRTALSMISFGFTIGKLGKVVQDLKFTGPLGNERTMSIESLGYFLVILGTLALLGATIQHWRRVREFHGMGLPRQFSISIIVALFLVAIGGFALTSLVMSL